MISKKLTVAAELENLQHESFKYFLHETNPANGLVIDKTEADWPASIAATGLALASYPVAVERGFMPRAAAVERTLTTLRFFWTSPQGPEPDATGYRTDYERILDEFDGSTVAEKSLARTYFDVVQSGARHGVVFPSEMLLQTKALVTMEALCVFMAPGFRFSEEMRPIVARRAAERVRPTPLLERLWTMLPDLVVTGEWFYTETQSRNRPAERAFRRDAVVAIAQAWIEAADAWLVAHRDVRFPKAEDRPHLAALLDLVAQAIRLAAPANARGLGEDQMDHPCAGLEATPQERWASFRRANRAGMTSASRADAASWRHGRPWLDASPAAFLPLARVALARAEAALWEQMDRAASEEQSNSSKGRKNEIKD